MTNIDENARETYYDPDTGVLVVSEVDPSMVEGATAARLPVSVQRALASWAEEVQGGRKRNRSIFERDRYVTPGKVYEQMAVAYDALDDDIVGNVADTSEAIAFQKMRFESEDKDQEDVWNQIARDLDLDSWVRQAWRELFTVSQFYGVRWWGMKEYKVRGKTDKGNEKRKTFNVFAPTGLGFLDPTRVVPVQNDIFGRSQLAWIASPDEMGLLDPDLGDDSIQTDELVQQLFLGQYSPTPQERAAFGKEDIPVDRLVLLNPMYVFRHTLTRSSYERWAKIRMKSLFPVLDLKHQLREMDRTWLLGGVNFVVLVTRGSDQIPTTKAEVDQTAAQVRSQSKSPIIVSDHRISMEIITPEVEHVLNQDKWAVLDERIMMRLWGTFQLPSETSSRETSLTLGRVIARGLASRRHMLKRTIEKEIIRPTVTHPLNVAGKFDGETKIEFSPRRMELEFDAALVTMLQELRDRGDISRETVLQEFNFDQKLEAQRREWEDERYKDVFKPVNVPFDSPNRTTPGGSGRQGGRPPGTSNTDGGSQGGGGESSGNAQ